MDYKELSARIDWNENRLRESISDLKKLKQVLQATQIVDESNEPFIMKMFNEKHRIEFALTLCNNNRKTAAVMMQMSERNFYRLLRKYNLD